jgi:hypothetical protein
LQLLDFDLLLPQEAGIAIVLDGKVLLFVGGGQRVRDVLGILEGLAIEKVRIRIWLLVVLGEEGGDKVLLAELVRVHGWWSEGERGQAGQPGLVVVVGAATKGDRGKSDKK